MRRRAALGLDKLVERRALTGADDREFTARQHLSRRSERRFDGGMAVTVAAEMREVNVAPPWARDRFEQRARAVIREMAMPSADALLRGPGAFVVGLEEMGAMVGFDDNDIALANMLMNVLRRVTEIGEPHERTSGRKQIVMTARETKTDRLVRIMWHGKTFDLKIAKTKTRARLKELPVGPVSEI